jgi:2-dehydro-3-deoxyphosphogluconate aldolase/(4S)-4-hydroxy-2-oxoglutarate aldolase
VIKIFPARELGGPSYISALRAPLPNLPLVPTGGVVLDDVAAYRRAGAIGLGIGSPLLPPALLSPVDADAIVANARRFCSAWHAAGS